MTVGEPSEKIFLWGQSAWTLNNNKTKQIVLFGGFGGIGRHARRNYVVMFDPQSGQLNEIDTKGPPSARLGHTSTVLGNQVFIIGGRSGPTQILNDVWVLDILENRWTLKECPGSMLQPRLVAQSLPLAFNLICKIQQLRYEMLDWAKFIKQICR